MKFAEHLLNSLVPEWKDKYIYYKLGKKKLKLLRSGDQGSADVVKDFIEDWVISVELNKCNGFYGWLLKQCGKNYLMLENQLAFYKSQMHLEDDFGKGSLPGESDIIFRDTSQGVISYGSIGSPSGMGSGRFKEFLRANHLLPSLPKFFSSNSFKKRSERYVGLETFGSIDTMPTAKNAQRMLADAVIEFYLYLQLVKTYRDLNVSGFKKIVKKFDKTFKTSELDSFVEYVNDGYTMFKDTISTSTDHLAYYETKVTEWYTDDLTNIHSTIDKKIHNNRLRKLTVQYSLSEQMIHGNNRSILQMFVAGLGIGWSSILFIFIIYKVITTTTKDFDFVHKVLFPLWGGWYMILLMSTLFILNCFIWHRTNINYRFIMFGEIHTKYGTQLFNNDFATSLIPLKLYFLIWFMIPCAILAFLSFSLKSLSPFAFIFLVWSLILFLLPKNDIVPYWDKLRATRKWLIVISIRLMFSGFFPVEFGDFFLGDIVCSLTYSIADIATFICVYSNAPNASCGSSSLKSMGVLSCLPSFWRFMQCLRRFADSSDWFPHLLNAGKYSMGIAYNASLSAYRISNHNPAKRKPFIIFATINSVCTSVWDIVMDWSFLQNFHGNNMFLRDDLYLAGRRNWKTGEYSWKRKLFYYIAIVLDVILRFHWIVYAIAPQTIQQSAVTSFVLACTEVFRRFIWIIFRVENEHVANVHLFKVSGDAPLPYPNALVNTNIDTPKNSHDSMSSAIPLSSTTSARINVPSSAYHGMFRRRASLFDNLSRSIPWAHASDFQRPATNSSNPMNESESESESESIIEGGI